MHPYSSSASIKVSLPLSVLLLDTYTHLMPLQSVNIHHQSPSIEEAMSPTLSTLPLETIIQILKSLPDRKTLSAAVRSSSHLHRAYLISREIIFTAVTLLELEKRGIDFWEPILYAEYLLSQGRPRESESHDLEIPLISFFHSLPKHQLISSDAQKFRQWWTRSVTRSKRTRLRNSTSLHVSY